MDLASLKAALKPLSNFGQEEITFSIPPESEGGQEVDVSLRALLPFEEIECQRHATRVLIKAQEEEELADDDPMTRAVALAYFDQYRIEVVAYALVQSGDVSFRGIKYVTTGEKLEDGTDVRIPLHIALRQLINAEWSRGMITISFSKYGELVTKVASKADRVAKESVEDLDAEIERTETRLKGLREDRESRAKGDPSITNQQIMNLVKVGESLERELDETIDNARSERRSRAAMDEARKEAEEELRDERTDSPSVDLDPETPEPVEEPPEPAEAETAETPQPAEPRKPVIPPRVPPPTSQPNPPQFRSSFEELDSPDSQAIEQDRILAARRQATDLARQEMEASDLSKAKKIGSTRNRKGEEIPIFEMPPSPVTPRGKEEGPAEATTLDPDPSVGTRNPRFKPSGD